MSFFVSEEQLKANAAEIKKEGGLNGYIRKQVEMIVDSLTLLVIDSELTAEVVSATASKTKKGKEDMENEGLTAAEGEKEAKAKKEAERMALIFDSKKFKLKLEGRHGQTDGDEMALPLIINSDGWMKGLGYEVLSTIVESIVRPGHVVQILGGTKAKSFNLMMTESDDA